LKEKQPFQPTIITEEKPKPESHEIFTDKEEVTVTFKKSPEKTQEEKLRKTAIEVLEHILLGEQKPSAGMKITLKFQGPFNLLGIESTEDSVFEYNYPTSDSNKKEEPEPQPQQPAKEKVTEQIF
jgi:hypothetical protein